MFPWKQQCPQEVAQSPDSWTRDAVGFKKVRRQEKVWKQVSEVTQYNKNLWLRAFCDPCSAPAARLGNAGNRDECSEECKTFRCHLMHLPLFWDTNALPEGTVKTIQQYHCCLSPNPNHHSRHWLCAVTGT